MIGIIVTGHGLFATGLQSSLSLIAGNKTNTYFVNFEETDSVDNLKEKLNQAIKQLNNVDHILILSDLTGGSPFKTAVELSVESSKRIEVIGGMNLAMLIELATVKDFTDSFDDFIKTALDIGKNSIIHYRFIPHSEDLSEEDGI